MTNENRPAVEHRTNFRDWALLFLAIYGSLWTSWEFMFKEILGPAKKSSSLEVRANMEIIGEQDDKYLIRVSIETNNPTGRVIYVPAYWFTVVGGQLKSFQEMQSAVDVSSTLNETRFSTVSSQDIVAQYKLTSMSAPGTASWWDPKCSSRNSEIFSVPKNKFDYLKLSVNWFSTRFEEDVLNVAWSADEKGKWLATPVLVQSVGQDLNSWQKKSASGYNWYETAIPLGSLAGTKTHLATHANLEP